MAAARFGCGPFDFDWIGEIGRCQGTPGGLLLPNSSCHQSWSACLAVRGCTSKIMLLGCWVVEQLASAGRKVCALKCARLAAMSLGCGSCVLGHRLATLLLRKLCLF